MLEWINGGARTTWKRHVPEESLTREVPHLFGNRPAIRVPSRLQVIRPTTSYFWSEGLRHP